VSSSDFVSAERRYKIESPRCETKSEILAASGESHPHRVVLALVRRGRIPARGGQAPMAENAADPKKFKGRESSLFVQEPSDWQQIAIPLKRDYRLRQL